MGDRIEFEMIDPIKGLCKNYTQFIIYSLAVPFQLAATHARA